MGIKSHVILVFLKVLFMKISLKNFIISGDQGFLMLMESKFLIKMIRPQNIKIKGIMFCGLVIFIRNSYPINIRRPWSPEIIMFCNEVIMKKLSNLSKPGGLGRPFDFTSFSVRSFLVLGHSLFTDGVFLVRYHKQRISWIY